MAEPATLSPRASERRGDWLAVALLIAIITILFADVLFLGAFPYYRDLSRYFFPAKAVLRTIVAGGEFPYWNPYFSGGQPLAANPEFEVFYPLQWLIFLPGFGWWLGTQLVLHIYIGALGMYALLRSRALLVASSFFGALSFAIGGFFLSYVNIPPFFFALTWVPLVFLFATRALEQPTVRNCSLAALLLGLVLLAGEPTTILQTGALMGAGAIYAGTRRRSLRAVLTSLGIVAIIVVLASLVGAVQILPAIDHVHDSVRGRGLALRVITGLSMPPIRPAEVFFPGFFGHISGSGVLYWGKALYTRSAGSYVISIYAGLLAACLAAAGVAARRRGWLLFVTVASVSFLLAIGEHTPLFTVLSEAQLLPSLRYPEKFVLAGGMALIIFAAFVADDALRGDRRVLALAGGLAALSGVIAAAMALSAGTTPFARIFARVFDCNSLAQAHFFASASRPDWLVAAIRGLIAAALLFILRQRGPSRAWFGAVVLFLLYDLGTTANRVVPRGSSAFFAPPPITHQLDPDRNDYRIFHASDVRHEPLNPGTVLSTEDLYLLTRNAFLPPLPSAWGYRTVLEPDYDASALLPTTRLFESLLFVTNMGRRLPPPVFLTISNVRFVLQNRKLQLSPDDDVQSTTPVSVTRADFAPRYYFADQLVQIRSQDEFLRAVTARPWSSRVAFVPFPPFHTAPGRLLRSSETANSIAIDVESSGRSLLVIGVTPHKYWQATIDGMTAPLMITNVGYQSLLIGPGRHQIRMRYRNPLIVRSGWLTLLAILGLMIAARFSWKGARGGEPATDS
ncbi:MAG: hypothetical protein ABI718_18375 [Acidobacteriota bacterium]